MNKDKKIKIHIKNNHWAPGSFPNIPISPGITSQKRIIYTTDGKVMSEKEIKMVRNIWWSVHKEDHEMCERLQEGRYSPISRVNLT